MGILVSLLIGGLAGFIAGKIRKVYENCDCICKFTGRKDYYRN